MGGGIGMGNTCKPMVDSCQCMTKPTTIKKLKKNKIKLKKKRDLGKMLSKDMKDLYSENHKILIKETEDDNEM